MIAFAGPTKSPVSYTGPFVAVVVMFVALMVGLALLWWFLDLGRGKIRRRGPRRRYTFDELGRVVDEIPRCPVCGWEDAPPGAWAALDRHMAMLHPSWRPPPAR